MIYSVLDHIGASDGVSVFPLFSIFRSVSTKSKVIYSLLVPVLSDYIRPEQEVSPPLRQVRGQNQASLVEKLG